MTSPLPVVPYESALHARRRVSLGCERQHSLPHLVADAPYNHLNDETAPAPPVAAAAAPSAATSAEDATLAAVTSAAAADAAHHSTFVLPSFALIRPSHSVPRVSARRASQVALESGGAPASPAPPPPPPVATVVAVAPVPAASSSLNVPNAVVPHSPRSPLSPRSASGFGTSLAPPASSWGALPGDPSNSVFSPSSRLSRGFTAWLSTHSPFSPSAASTATSALHSPNSARGIGHHSRARSSNNHQPLLLGAPSSSIAPPLNPSPITARRHQRLVASTGALRVAEEQPRQQQQQPERAEGRNTPSPPPPPPPRPDCASIAICRSAAALSTTPAHVISHSVVADSSEPRNRSDAEPRDRSDAVARNDALANGPTLADLSSPPHEEPENALPAFTYLVPAFCATPADPSVPSAFPPAAAAAPPSPHVVNMHPEQSLSVWHADGNELSFFDSLASYGFRADDDNPEKLEWLARYAVRLEQQEAAWAEVQDRRLHSLSIRTFKVLSRDGLPAAYRAAVWWHWLGPDTLRIRCGSGYYSSLLVRPEERLDAETYRNVCKDVDRTFTAHPFFKDPQGEGVVSLRRLLLAYAVRNQNVGYCQGMNFLGGFLLLFYPEESAFWMLAQLVESFLPSDYFSATMVGVAADAAILVELVSRRLPRLWAHLEELECTALDGVFTGWFLTLFVKSTPVETTLRVLDSLLCEGTKVLFRVGLALLALHESELLACQDFGEAFQLLSELGRREYDCDRLMRKAFAFRRIKRAWLEQERAKQVKRLTIQYEEMERKRRTP